MVSRDVHSRSSDPGGSELQEVTQSPVLVRRAVLHKVAGEQQGRRS